MLRQSHFADAPNDDSDHPSWHASEHLPMATTGRCEKLHDCYVVTELGGVQFHVGLDDGNPGETDEVDLLEEPQRKEVTFLMSQPRGDDPPQKP